MNLSKELQRAAVWAVVFSFVALSYAVTAHLGYAHGYDAGYHAIETESNQQ